MLGVIPLEIQEIPIILKVEVIQVDGAPAIWMTPIQEYIHRESLLKNKVKPRHLGYQVARYVEYDRILYKRGFNEDA